MAIAELKASGWTFVLTEEHGGWATKIELIQAGQRFQLGSDATVIVLADLISGLTDVSNESRTFLALAEPRSFFVIRREGQDLLLRIYDPNGMILHSLNATESDRAAWLSQISLLKSTFVDPGPPDHLRYK